MILPYNWNAPNIGLANTKRNFCVVLAESDPSCEGEFDISAVFHFDYYDFSVIMALYAVCADTSK